MNVRFLVKPSYQITLFLHRYTPVADVLTMTQFSEIAHLTSGGCKA